MLGLHRWRTCALLDIPGSELREYVHFLIGGLIWNETLRP
jgi:hypothetical protein